MTVKSEGLQYTSNGSLVIERVLTEHSGSYSCVASNDFTSAAASFRITPGGEWSVHCNREPTHLQCESTPPPWGDL